MLHVVRTHPPLVAVDVPYHADMQCFEYLRNILVPALKAVQETDISIQTRHNGDTVLECFFHALTNTEVFTRANRLTRLGDLVPSDAVLLWTTEAKTSFIGNATQGDMTILCPVCNDAQGRCTDYELVGCAHRAHFFCLLERVSTEGAHSRCPYPGCTEPFLFPLENLRLRNAMDALLRY